MRNARPIAVAVQRMAHSHAAPSNSLFKEINKLASEGRWDSVKNAPMFGKCGDKRKEALAVYQRFNTSSDVFTRTEYGPFYKLAWRLFLTVAFFTAVFKGYETFMPKEKVYQYKYRHQHGHDEHH